MKNTSILATTLLLLLVNTASAAGIKGVEDLQPQLKTTRDEPSYQVFVTSTEMQIGKAKPIIDQAPKGLYLTVGSERGFRAATLSRQVTDLLLLDFSPKIVQYNHLNIKLLKAETLAEYRTLRWSASFNDWRRFARKVRSKSGEDLRFSREEFDWWNQNVRDLNAYSYYPLPELLNRYEKDIYVEKFSRIRDKLEKIFERLKNSGEQITQDSLYYPESYTTWTDANARAGQPTTMSHEDWEWWKKYVGNGKDWAYASEWAKDIKTLVDLGQVMDFKSSNYFFQPELYRRLHKLAIKNRITTLAIDLSDEKQVSLLASKLSSLGIPIAVLDLDNTYDDYYIGEAKYHHLLHKLMPIGTPRSILLAMRNYKDWGSGQFQTYVGFRFENVAEWPNDFSLMKLFKGIPEAIQEIINGRLYERSEMPPAAFYRN